MKSFSQRTKESLLTVESGKKCCQFAELLGISLFAGRIRHGELKILSELEGTVEKFNSLLSVCFGKDYKINEGKGNYYCIVSDKQIIRKIFGAEIDMDSVFSGIPEKIFNKECCRSAFLRGAFLGGGTVVDPNKNYNIEFLVPDGGICDNFVKMLELMKLGFRKTMRKNCLVLYAKNSETIGDTLAYMGAFGAQMELLNVRIEKELRNDMNRVANSETANMDKVLTAAALQLAAIQKIDSSIGLDNIADELREVAILRYKYKDISLEKLGKMLTPPLSKSGVNHRIKKIMSIAENL